MGTDEPLGAASRALRVAVLIDSLIAGGAERVAVDAAAATAGRAGGVHVIVSRHTGPLESAVRAAGIPYTILGRRRGFSPRRLARAIRITRRADLLHAHKLAGGSWGVLIGMLARRPVVVHEHTWDGRASRRRALLYRCWIGRRAKAVICVSESVAASVVRDGVNPRLVRVVPNGVPLDAALDRAAARSILGLEDGRPVVGIVGRLRPEKRHDLLLRAAALAYERGADFDVCVVGDGPCRDDLHHLAAALGIGSRVHWAGEQPDAGRLVSAFGAAVICSDFEGMPLAALEALAAGTPLVATSVGALPEILGAGTGLLVPPGDADALAAALAEIVRDDAARDGMARRARELARTAFGIDRMASELESIYADVLSGR
jgi:glycosyltransferase involved in cell wall biosynthesis